MDLEGLRRRHSEARPDLELVRFAAEDVLQASLSKRHIKGAQISGRTKDTASFVKKVLRKGYADPWSDIRDKVGLRVTTPFASSVPSIVEVVRASFDVVDEQDKRSELDPNRFDYLATHFEVRLQDPGALRQGAEVFEVQVRSSAETAWADVSHELLYKLSQDPPVDAVRSIHRLLALVELFDAEVTRAQSLIMTQPGHSTARILDQLEAQFFSLRGADVDLQLSRYLVDLLSSSIPSSDLLDYPNAIQAFTENHRDKLAGIYRRYVGDDRNPLMSQPESLMVFERLENGFYGLSELWREHLPRELLESLANAWGKPLDDEPW